MPTPIFGLVGTGSWQTYARPESWRSNLLYYWPNGEFPLTALMSMLKSENVTDPIHHWWVQGPPEQGGSLGTSPSYVYTDAACASAYTTGGVAGSTLYVKVPDAIGAEIRDGHIVQLGSTDHYMCTANAIVGHVYRTTGNYRLTVTLLEADDNDSSNTLAAADYVLVVGSGHSESGEPPSQIAYEPTLYTNYIQKFWNTLQLNSIVENTTTRYGSPEYQRLKKLSFYLHGLEMEKAAWFGVAPSNGYVTDDDGSKIWLADGLFSFLKANGGAGYVADFRVDPAYAGKKWTDAGGGEDWLEDQIELAYRFGSETGRIGMCGSGAAKGANALAKTFGNLNLESGTAEYGIKVRKLIAANGELAFKTVPLFNQHSIYRNCMVILNTKNTRFRPLQAMDTKFVKESTTSSVKTEGYQSVGTFEWGSPKEFMVLYGVGQDNVL